MTDATAELLIRARGFLERGWCRNAFARGPLGWPVFPKSKLANRWCASGALLAAGLPDNEYRTEYWTHPAVYRLREAMDWEDISRFNDRQAMVEPVLAAFDRAIAMGDR